MGEDLDERVLHGFVGFGGVAQILVGDAKRAALVRSHQPGEPLARLVHAPTLDQSADLDRQPRVLGLRHASRSARAAVAALLARVRAGWSVGVTHVPMVTHAGLRPGP